VFRIVQNRPSKVEDFISERSLGRPPFGDDPQALELHGGVSVWETKVQATLHARLFNQQTLFLVTLDQPEHPLRSERTTSVAGHRTVTAEPIDIYSRSIRSETMSSSANGGGERHWEVWSNATRNLLGYFSTEIKALTALSDAQRKSGSAYIRSLTLAAVDGSHVDAMTDQRLLRHLKKPRD
jgi:hypothetical protein